MIQPAEWLERPFLSVTDLTVAFPTEDGLVRAVDGVSLSLEKGKTLAIVGESGSGKSVTAQAIMGLINRKAAQITGQIWIGGQELIAMPEPDVQALRGDEMAMIFQDPMSSLHPFYRIGDQQLNVHARKDGGELVRGEHPRGADVQSRAGAPGALLRAGEDVPGQEAAGPGHRQGRGRSRGDQEGREPARAAA